MANGGPDIVVLGGPGAISDAVVEYLDVCTNAEVSRVAGSDRYATAAAFAQWAGFPSGGTAFIATGENFPDALAAGPRASEEIGPILLTRPTSLPGPTVSAFNAEIGDFAYELSGWGDDVVAAATPGDVAGVIRFEYDTGSSNFAVWSLDSNLGLIDLLVNEIGYYRGTRPVNTYLNHRDDPMRYLDVTASGRWTATVMSLNFARQLTTSVSGTTDDVVRVGKGGIAQFSYTGSSNFAVWALGNADADLLVNEIGIFSGTEVIPTFSEYLDITGQGDWTIAYK